MDTKYRHCEQGKELVVLSTFLLEISNKQHSSGVSHRAPVRDLFLVETWRMEIVF